MKLENIKKLQDHFPYLIPRNVYTGELVETDTPYLLGFPDSGWERLFLLYCMHLRPHLLAANHLESFQFTQLKEKYGSMRLYDTGAPNSAYAEGLERIYEYLGTVVCSRCGELTKYETLGYVEYLCKSCMKKLKKKIGVKIRRRRFKKVLVSTICSGSGITYRKYRIRPYLKEYLKCKKMDEDTFVDYLLKGC